jgi:hypothetical protein
MICIAVTYWIEPPKQLESGHVGGCIQGEYVNVVQGQEAPHGCSSISSTTLSHHYVLVMHMLVL